VTRVAAIDCGTNSIRLLVADLFLPHPPSPRNPQPLPQGTDVVRRMEIVRLGQGVDRTGRLAPEALERTRLALAVYAAEIARLGAERVRMVATSATRDARNAGEFTAMVEEILGVTPEVVSGDEEARLSFAGGVRGLPADTEPPYLVVDIGGGSTEFVLGTSTVEQAVSVDVGCVRMTERYLHSDPPTTGEVAAAEAEIEATVDRVLSLVPGRNAGTLVGLAGSVTTVAAIALDLDKYRPDRIHHARISYDEVAKVTADLLGMTTAQRLAIPVMHPGRADVIGAGALVLRVAMERAGATSMVASEHDILDGIAWSLLGA
jgi:exopolyphosphatase / guanosine-5'-triphosphate,3'-diphosphate pyrophosphatase